MRLCRILSLIILNLVLLVQLTAQIYSPSASDSFSASYNLPGGTDKVFIYNRPAFKGDLMASIMALSSDRQSGWNFQWAVYDRVLKLYSPLPYSVNGSISTIDTITGWSGYQVTMTKDTIVNTYRVWIIFNDYNVEITNKDAGDKLLFGYFNCSSLDLRSDTSVVRIFYFNPVTGARIDIYNNYSIRWKTDNPDASTPSSRLITRVNSPPSKDTWYFINLTDRFNLVRSDSVFYKSIQSDAKITAEYVGLGDSVEYKDLNYDRYYANDIKSAPGKYRFDISGSANSATYKIDFGDGQSIETDSAEAKVVHEFKLPGTYKAVLTTKSDKPYECVDSASAEADLAYGKFFLPNVFSPNGDGENDELNFYENNNVFRSEDVSVVSIEISIFDRAGRKVHLYNGNIRDWPGWDGFIMKSNREAPEGVYFYSINALLYYRNPVDDPKNKVVFQGFFHLYRE